MSNRLAYTLAPKTRLHNSRRRVCTQALGANVQVSLLSLLHYDSSVDATVVYQVFVVQVSLRCKRASLLGL
jgi:hypothetical protein